MTAAKSRSCSSQPDKKNVRHHTRRSGEFFFVLPFVVALWANPAPALQPETTGPGIFLAQPPRRSQPQINKKKKRQLMRTPRQRPRHLPAFKTELPLQRQGGLARSEQRQWTHTHTHTHNTHSCVCAWLRLEPLLLHGCLRMNERAPALRFRTNTTPRRTTAHAANRPVRSVLRLRVSTTAVQQPNTGPRQTVCTAMGRTHMGSVCIALHAGRPEPFNHPTAPGTHRQRATTATTGHPSKFCRPPLPCVFFLSHHTSQVKRPPFFFLASPVSTKLPKYSKTHNTLLFHQSTNNIIIFTTVRYRVSPLFGKTRAAARGGVLTPHTDAPAKSTT